MPVTSSQWLHTRKFPQWNSEIWQSPEAITDWERILVVPRTEMRCKCLFLALPSLFQNIQQGTCFDFEHYFQEIPFPIPKQAFPEVVFVLSKVFLFHPKSGVLTFWNQGNKKMQDEVYGSYWSWLSNFFISFQSAGRVTAIVGKTRIFGKFPFMCFPINLWVKCL